MEIPGKEKSVINRGDVSGHNSGKILHINQIPSSFASKPYEYIAITAVQLDNYIELLEEKYNVILQMPIEILENKLFNLTQRFSKSLNWEISDKTALNYLHPLVISMEQIEGVKSLTPTLLNHLDNGDPVKEYGFIREFVRFLNDLLISWGILNVFNYKIRFSESIMVVSCINHEILFSDFVNMEILWYACIVSSSNLSNITSKELKEIGKILVEEFWKIFEILLGCNRVAVTRIDSIQGYLCSTNSSIANYYGFTKQVVKEKPEFQKLSNNFFQNCCSKRSHTIAILKEAVSQFELAYQEFESCLLTTLQDVYAKRRLL